MGTIDALDRLRAVAPRRLVVAPMAGGPSTPGLVAAGAEAGALGFLAAGYKTVAAMAAEQAALEQAGIVYGVNLFVPGEPVAERSAVARYVAGLGPGAGRADWDDDGWPGKVEALLRRPPALVGFTFGCPPADLLAAFAAAGSLAVVTVTDPAEAALAVEAGAPCLCAQGVEAGAHRGSFRNDDGFRHGLSTLALLAAVRDVAPVPVIAAGGIATAAGVAAALAGGAAAVQVGTAFLRCPESGANATYKAALADPRFTETSFTRAFSGRPARGLVNRFLADHPDAPAAYPEINNATRPLRAVAAAGGDADSLSLWAGTGWRSATDRPAAEVAEMLTA